MFLIFLLARRFEGKREFLLDFLRHLSRDANPAWSGQLLQPGCDVHPFAISILAVDDHLADVDPDADIEPFLLRHGAIALAIPRCRDTAHSTASTTLPNSARRPSPINLKIRP